MTEEEIADHINNIIAGEANCKRIIIWNVRHLKELRKLETWLKDEQGRIRETSNKA